MKKLILAIVIIAGGFINPLEVNAQPYYYFHYRDKSEAPTVLLRPSYWDFTKHQISFLPIPNEIELPNNNWAFDLRWDSTQKWLTCHEPYELFDLTSKTKLMDLPYADDNTRINELVYSAKRNKLFIEYFFDGNKFRYDNEKYMYVIDLLTKIVKEKLNMITSEIGHENEPMFLSRDENTLYFYIEDTLAYHQKDQYNSDSLCYFSTITNSTVKKEPLSKFGYPNASYYRIKDGHDGKGIVVSAIESDQPNHEDVYYRIYDFDNNTGSNFIKIDLGKSSKEYFTNNGRYIVFPTEAEYGRGIYAPDGGFYIYDMNSGQLVKTLNLPPQGKVFTFQNYPNKLYYFLYNYQTQQGSSYSIDVDSLVNQSVGAKVKLVNSSGSKLNSGSLQYYEGTWKDAVNNNDGTFSVPTTLKNVSLKMNYAYGSQTKNNVSIGADTIVFQTTNVQVKLLDSRGAILDTGKVQYYAGAWRELGVTNNGVAAKELLPGNYSFRINYGFASRDKVQDISTNNIVVFQTVPATVQLKNSSGNFINESASVQYYSGAWRNLGVTTSGAAVKELLPNSYSFRINFAFASIDKTQDLSTNNVVLFQTVAATVQLKNSLGNAIDQGTVQYYSGAWRDFGTTLNGVASKELLPNSYSFRMNYAFASLDKTQNVDTNPTVVFQTVNAKLQLKNSSGGFIDTGKVQYYSGAWRDFGATVNGIATKELLPISYSFRMNYSFALSDKVQDISKNNTIIFQTVPATVQLKNSLNIFIDQGTVQYYSGAWRDFGSTANGVVVKELLPQSYSFRMSYAFASLDKSQNISTNPVVVFQTVPATVQLKNSMNNFIDQGTVQYYSGAWRDFGSTVNGIVVKELLPNSYSFRMKHEFISLDKTQHIGTNNIILFNTVLARISVTDNLNQLVNNAMVSYYSGAWRQVGNTINGVITKELLPVSLSFRAALGTKQVDKTQNIGINNNIDIKLP